MDERVPRHWACRGRYRLAIFVFLFAACVPARAQDHFEIHVLEYEPLRLGEFTLEEHLNYVGLGQKEPDGPLPSSHGQFHMTSELTAGATDYFSAGFMQSSAKRPGNGLEYVGWGAVLHFYAREKWHWPVSVGLVTEFSFEKAAFEENTRSIEIVPIIEKRLGRVQLDVNPAFGHALQKPTANSDAHRGWSFEPAARVAYQTQKRFTPSLEYYGSWGKFDQFSPWHEQVHQFLPGGDLRIGRNVLWSFGVGVGVTPAGDRLEFKSRIEISFGHARRDGWARNPR